MYGMILVTGGTGGLGRRVVPRLVESQRRVRVLSRKPQEPADGVEFVVGDLVSGAGVEAAVRGCDVVLHCAATGKPAEDTVQIDNLVRAAKAAGVRHLLNISVVGCERIPVVSAADRAMFAYFAGQRAVEVAIERSGIPWTNLRATQFHDGFILVMVRAMAKLPVIPVPAGIRFQPVDAGAVAARLAELTLGPPAGQVPDLAGPRVYTAGELLRSYLAAVGKRRLLVPMPMFGAAARAVRAGANLAPDGMRDAVTWEDFLRELAATRPSRPAPASA